MPPNVKNYSDTVWSDTLKVDSVKRLTLSTFLLLLNYGGVTMSENIMIIYDIFHVIMKF